MKLEKLKKDYGDNILWFGRKHILGMPISLTRYILTDTTLYTSVGLLNVKEDEIELYKVLDRQLRLPFGQRIFGCGTVVLVTKDTDTPEKELKAIKKPRDVKKIADEAIRLQRDKYMIRGRDMVGAVIDDHDGADDHDCIL